MFPTQLTSLWIFPGTAKGRIRLIRVVFSNTLLRTVSQSITTPCRFRILLKEKHLASQNYFSQAAPGTTHCRCGDPVNRWAAHLAGEGDRSRRGGRNPQACPAARPCLRPLPEPEAAQRPSSAPRIAAAKEQAAACQARDGARRFLWSRRGKWRQEALWAAARCQQRPGERPPDGASAPRRLRLGRSPPWGAGRLENVPFSSGKASLALGGEGDFSWWRPSSPAPQRRCGTAGAWARWRLPPSARVSFLSAFPPGAVPFTGTPARSTPTFGTLRPPRRGGGGGVRAGRWGEAAWRPPAHNQDGGAGSAPAGSRSTLRRAPASMTDSPPRREGTRPRRGRAGDQVTPPPPLCPRRRRRRAPSRPTPPLPPRDPREQRDRGGGGRTDGRGTEGYAGREEAGEPPTGRAEGRRAGTRAAAAAAAASGAPLWGAHPQPLGEGGSRRNAGVWFNPGARQVRGAGCRPGRDTRGRDGASAGVGEGAGMQRRWGGA